MSARRYWIVLTALITLVMMTLPVNASPSLSLGNHASYDLSGFVHVDTTCIASPPGYTSQVCGYYTPPPPPQNQTITIYIIDNGVCQAANPTSCFFAPSFVNTQAGSFVRWYNNGTLTHTVATNNTLNPGLPSFSGLVGPSTYFSTTVNVPGLYNYYDVAHPWMKGVVNVSPTLPPPPTVQPPSSVKVGLSGNLAWTVKGLDKDTANLQVDHSIAVAVSPIPGLTITPVTETGSFEQSVTLSTRTESPGTATKVIQNLLSAMSTNYYSGIGPSPFLGQGPSLFSGSTGPDYTMWWVNGPLAMGSPVLILGGSSSVTGEESLNLGSLLGTRSGWLVTSNFTESVDITTNPLAPGSRANFALNLLWSYDKQTDLLLRSSMNATATTNSSTQQPVYTSITCPPYNTCYPSYVLVTVNRTSTFTLNLALTLGSTDLSLNNRTIPNPSATNQAGILSGLAIPFGQGGVLAISAVLAGALASGVWYVDRSRRRLPAAIRPVE